MQKNWPGWGEMWSFEELGMHIIRITALCILWQKSSCGRGLSWLERVHWWPRAWGLNASFYVWTEHTITLASWILPSGWSGASSLLYVCTAQCTFIKCTLYIVHLGFEPYSKSFLIQHVRVRISMKGPRKHVQFKDISVGGHWPVIRECGIFQH